MQDDRLSAAAGASRAAGPLRALRRAVTHGLRFSGRASIPEYWWFILFLFVGAILARIGDAMLFPLPDRLDEPRMAMQSPTRPLSLGWFLLTLLPLVTATVRRLHDTGRSAWHLFVPVGLSLAATAAIVAFVTGAGMLEPWRLEELHWRGVAIGAGLLGLLSVALLQIILVILMLWYLTTPTEPRTNRYGPPPAEAE